MKKRSLILVALVALVGLAPTSARSQPAPAGVEASQKADEFFRAGKTAYKAGKLRESYEAYRSAWSLKRTYDIAANLANAELQLGMKRDAAEHYAFCVRNFPPTGGAAQREKTLRHFEEARQDVGALTLKVNVDGAEVLVDGHVMGRTPIAEEVFVEPGTRVVEVRLAGYATATQTVQAAKGARQVVTLVLVAAVVPPGAAPSVVAPGVDAGATQGAATATVPPVAPTATPPEKGPRTVVLVTGGALTGVALVLGTAFAVISNGKASDASAKLSTFKQMGRSACAQHATVCADVDTAWGARDGFANASVGAFLGAGAIGVATLGYLLLAPKRASSSGARVLPMVGVSQAGAMMTGVW